MANKKHLALIKQGIDIWNNWRYKNPEIVPDFSGTLSHIWYCREAKFRGNKVEWGTNFSASSEFEALPHNLSGADLSGANLSRVDLGSIGLSNKYVNGNPIGANLSGANLSGANLSGACLNDADLTDANLSNADLSGALLNGTNLTRSNLNNADLSGSGIDFTNFTGANLKGTKFARVKFNVESIHLSMDAPTEFKLKFNLREADLSGADLSGFDLSDANLSEVSLIGADLSEANLIRTDLSGADLRRSNLTRTQALYTNLTSAKLTGACLEDWNINSATAFDAVVCNYFYWRSGQQERRPRQGNFASGEFTALFQKAQESVDLIFTNGLDWAAFFTSFQKLQVKCGSDELFIQAFENKNGAFIIRVHVPLGVDQAEIERYLKRQYELETQLQSKSEQLANLMEITRLLASKPINIEARAIAESESMSEASKYNQSHAQIGNLVDTARDNSRQQSINHQHNYPPQQQQNLIHAAAEIQQLLQQLEKTYPTNTPLEKQVVVTEALKQIESNPTLKARVIAALKAGGVEALKELVDNPLINILVAALEGWQEAE